MVQYLLSGIQQNTISKEKTLYRERNIYIHGEKNFMGNL